MTAADLLAAVRDDADDALVLLARLVGAESPTGAEGPAAVALAEWLDVEGLEPEVRPVEEELRDRYPALSDELGLHERPNVYGWWRSDDAGRPPLVLNGHVDVVPADPADGWTVPPFGGLRRDGRVWGRGTSDMKGGIVAALFAVRALRRAGIRPRHDVQIQGVMGEETGGLGTLSAIATEPRPFGAIVLEPTDCVVAAACGGNLQFRIAVDGIAAHTAVPWCGISAAEKLWVVYQALQDFTDRRNAGIDHPLFRALPMPVPTGIGTFRAGRWHSTLPEHAELAGRVGLLPGESLDTVRAALLEAVAATEQQDPWLGEHPPRLEWIHEGFAAWETQLDDPVVTALDAACVAATGERRLGAVTYGSDAGHFAQAGVPTVLFGPGVIEDAHRVDESIAEEQLLRATEILALALAGLVGPGR
jgi:acetylornithine deacetylase